MYKNVLNRLKGSIIYFLIVLLVTSILPYKEVMAVKENRSYSNKTFEDNIEIKKDVSLSGVFGSHTWNFNIDEKTEVKKAELNLQFEITDVLTDEIGSYFTFLINGTEFYSTKLERNNGAVQSLRVDIPINMIKDGFNEFRIEGYLRLSKEPCTDDYNTANWAVLKKESVINITKGNMLADNKINEFPYPFANEGGFSKTKVIIPKDYKDYELQNALKMQGILGEFGGDILNDIESVDLSESNIIYIGRKEGLEERLLSEGIRDYDSNKEGLIEINTSPVGISKEEKILYILADNEDELNAALSFLMNRELVEQVDENSTLVNSSMDLKSRVSNNKNKYTFKELGYFQKPVEGLFRRSTSIIYNLPKNKRLGVDDVLNINFRYSENLDFDRSLFTVFINDNPIASKKLEKEKANGDSIAINIPKDATNSSAMEIKFAFDLNLNDINCEVNKQEQPWAVILDDSTLTVNERKVETYFFDSYPAPFVSDWSYNELLFVLPDNLKNEDLTAIGNMVAYMGSGIKYNLGELLVVSSSKLENQHKNKNIVVYGTPDNNKLVKDLNSNMWLKYNDDFTNFISNEKVSIMSEYGKSITSFQLDVSPFDNSRYMLLLTSKNENYLRKSLRYLSEDKLFYKLKGDGVIVDKNGDIKNFTYKEGEDELTYEKLKNIDKNTAWILVIWGLLGVFILVSVALYINKSKKLRNLDKEDK